MSNCKRSVILALSVLAFASVASSARADEPVADRAPPVVEKRSTPLFVTGLVVAPVGAVTAIVGAVFIGIGKGHKSFDTCNHGVCGSPTTPASGDAGPAGVGMVVGGLSAVVLGTVFILVGGQRVSVGPKPIASSVTPLVGPKSVGLQVSF